MPPVRALHLATRIAPLERGEDAEAAAALSRALVQAGERVLVVTRRPVGVADADLERLGLARRLDPLRLAAEDGDARLTVREGRLAGGAVPVAVLEGSGAEDDELLAVAALELSARRGAWPDLVRAWDDAPHVCALAEERHPPDGHPVPAAVLLLRDAGSRPVTPALRDAIAAAHRAALPSGSYVEDALQSGEGELVELLRAAPDEVRGIPAGIDEHHWNPTRDPYLPAALEPTRAGKSELKRALRRDLGLASSNAPLVCAMGPLELLDRDSAEALAHAGAHLIFCHEKGALPGSEQIAHDLAHDHPMRVRSLVPDPALHHRVVAAADLALFCHRFQPGGFSPLYCMPYGVVPIAPRSGAFADAVVDWDAATETGTGFVYSLHRPEDMPAALRRALRAYSSGESWGRLVARVAGADVSWRTAGVRHAELGREAIRASRQEVAPAA